MKYYKVLNIDECHHGFQYKEGLNVDTLPFYPKGRCEAGGLYFASEDILYFLDYGPIIREVTLPEGEEVYKDNEGVVCYEHPIKYKAHRIILGPRQNTNDMKFWEGLLADGTIQFRDDLNIVTSGVRVNNLALVKLLLSDGRINPGMHSNHAIQLASANGNVEMISLLMSDNRVDPTDDKCLAIEWAFCNLDHTRQKDTLSTLLKDDRFKNPDHIMELKTILLARKSEMESFKFKCLSEFNEDYSEAVKFLEEFIVKNDKENV